MMPQPEIIQEDGMAVADTVTKKFQLHKNPSKMRDFFIYNNQQNFTQKQLPSLFEQV